MDEEMNLSEIAIQVAEENQTRKILLIIQEVKKEEKDSEKAMQKIEDKIKALLNK